MCLIDNLFILFDPGQSLKNFNHLNIEVEMEYFADMARTDECAKKQQTTDTFCWYWRLLLPNTIKTTITNSIHQRHRWNVAFFAHIWNAHMYIVYMFWFFNMLFCYCSICFPLSKYVVLGFYSFVLNSLDRIVCRASVRPGGYQQTTVIHESNKCYPSKARTEVLGTVVVAVVVVVVVVVVAGNKGTTK